MLITSLLLVAACGASRGVRDPDTTPSPSAPNSYSGHAHGLSDRLILPTHAVRSATAIPGTLVVVNSTGKTIEGGSGCVVRYQVVLHNGRYTPTIAWPADCEINLTHGAESFPPGVTNIPVTLSTTMAVCDQQGPSGPHECDLPPGIYQTELVGTAGNLLPAPPPIQVTLLP
jgi:hypothetical protein